MKVITESVVVPVAVADVFSYVQDYDRRSEWDVRVKNAERLTAAPLGAGARVRYTFNGILGMTFWLEVDYIAYQPPQQSAIKVVRGSWGSIYREAAGSWHFEEVKEGTRFTTKFSYTLRWGAIGRLMDRLFVRRMSVLETRESLQNLRRILIEPLCDGFPPVGDQEA